MNRKNLKKYISGPLRNNFLRLNRKVLWRIKKVLRLILFLFEVRKKIYFF